MNQPLPFNRTIGLSASIVCANMLNIGHEVEQINQAGLDTIHFDVMDGNFVPRLGLHPEMLAAVRSRTDLPIDVHLMVNDPEPYLAPFIEAGATYMTVHAENNQHLLRTVQKIKKMGARPGIALNPATPLSTLDYLWDEIDLVLIMGINPGIVGHPLWSGTFRKISEVRQQILARGSLAKISVDGGVNFQSAANMVSAGADWLVCGTSTIYQPPTPLAQKVAELRAVLNSVPMIEQVFSGVR